MHEILATVLYYFRRVSPRRRLRTQSSKFTSVGLKVESTELELELDIRPPLMNHVKGWPLQDAP